ncbi:hypothetical protein AN641_05370 [Candidatus Epulonipiscioides gigas]|nr:hypothetical protein AN641_05370 [Epulopiscium sp. SCG-C07WGA-EpuloA2]
MVYNTKNRQKILELIKNQQDRYVSIDDISISLENQDIKISLSTIYRYIDYLVKENLISKHIDTDAKKSYFRYIGDDLSCKEHLHLKCKTCGTTIHLPEGLIKKENINNFKIEYDASVITGVCENCQ